MKKYMVYVTLEVHGNIEVEAENTLQAGNIVAEMPYNELIESMDNLPEFEIEEVYEKPDRG